MNQVFVALVRHGDYHQRADVPSAHQPFPLTQKGEAEAAEAADEVSKLASQLGAALYPVIYSSNLLRGWQTAEIMRGRLGFSQPVEGRDDLAERALGSAANLSIAEIAEIMAADPRFDKPPQDWKSNSHYQLPLQGAESLMQAGARVAQGLNAIAGEVLAAAPQPQLVSVIGHGAAFRHAAHHLGVLAFDQIAKLSMYHARPVVLRKDDGGLWRHVAGDWKVRPRADEAMD